MLTYVIRRLLLLPLTLFCILLVNFTIINLAPGDPTTITEVSQEGATKNQQQAAGNGGDTRYLQFREFYGLTLPVVLNLWPNLTMESVQESLTRLLNDRDKMEVKEYKSLRTTFGDQSRFVMPQLLQIISDPNESDSIRHLALSFFVRGGTRQGVLGPNTTMEEKKYNQKVAEDNQFLKDQLKRPFNDLQIHHWYEANKEVYHFEPTPVEKIGIFFFETRFYRYMSRVLTLDFGTLRNDQTKTVIGEVSKRFKYSLTLSLIPMLLTFFLCQVFGFTMAMYQNQWPDFSQNVIFLILFAVPVFVVAPFLIEKVALNHTFPFTHIPIPFSGFTSPDAIYATKTSVQRLFDTMQHIFLPLIAIMYGSLAASSRLSRTAVLEVMRHDYVRTAKAKGVPPGTIWVKHVGRNAAITIATSLAGSLGVILGGSLIVETIFEIDGFGKFFYDAIINRDYNVIMFSAIAGSFLTLLGYLAADLAYTVLDPRVTLD